MSSNEKLKELFNKCCEELTDETARQIKFVFLAGKEKTANLLECRDFLGYGDPEDPKKDAAKATEFRAKVFHPLRDHITRRLLGVSQEEAQKLWTRGRNSDEDKANREKVLAALPKAARRSSEKDDELDIGEIIGDI